MRAGEVVGIAGLMGAGRTEFAMSLFGRAYGTKISGEVLMHGKPVDVSTIPKAKEAGLAYVTEDRKTFGLVLIDHIKHNVTLANLNGVAERGVVNDIKEIGVASKYRKDLGIRSSSIYQTTVNLSGGNQQKVVLSKWLFSGPEVLILDEPTRGIDVGASMKSTASSTSLPRKAKRDRDLVGDARAARHLRPHLRDETKENSWPKCRPERRRRKRSCAPS